ncbi:hypothetical protein [Tsuneonella sp. HG222]
MTGFRLVPALPAALALALSSAPVAAEDAYKAKRTEWGDPDLTGRWPIDYLAQTPRQRAPGAGTRADLTDEEYEAALRNAREQQSWIEQEGKANKMGMGHWIERGLPLRQNSLITEPADGRIPAMTEEGARLAALQKSSWTEDTFIWANDFNPFDRCITRGMPGSMLPGNYNSGIEIWQSPGYAAIRLEMIHETRIIPIGKADAPPPAVRNWLGFSRGHFEGETLVIETTNFVPGVPISNVGNSPRPVPNSEQMKIVERLTPTGPDTIRYEAWVTDPVTLTGTFKYDFPWQRNSDYEQFEYACHEGNVQFRGYITSTSPFLAKEREAAWAAREADGTARDAGGGAK